METIRIAIVLFVLAVACGPIYTARGYSVVLNVISELAAQNTPRNYVMAAAFVVLGAAVVGEGVMAFRWPLVPFMLFGVAFGAAGLFGHRPISAEVPYVAWRARVHSALATVSGIALTVGFIWDGAGAQGAGDRAVSLALAAVCVALPLLMLNAPRFQGLIQRVMYLLVFAWLWTYYPWATHT